MGLPRWKPPAICVPAGLIVLAIPVLMYLGAEYGETKVRLRNAAVARTLSPAPGEQGLLQLVQSVDPGAGFSLTCFYAPEKVRPTGIAGVYAVQQQAGVRYWLAVFRYDIACGKCKDILAAALYAGEDLSLQQIFLLNPWDIDGQPVDTGGFLKQFSGIGVQTELVVGGNVVALEESRQYTQGLVRELKEVREWLLGHVDHRDRVQ